MDESQLTPKQLQWIALSKKIGLGPLTKSERKALEELYAEMLPAEQQDLQRYIRITYGKPEDEQAETTDEFDPIAEMERRVWTKPSDALRAAFTRIGVRRIGKPSDRS